MSRYLSPSNEPNEMVTNALSRIEGTLIDLYVMMQDLKTKNDQLEVQVAALLNNTTENTPTTNNEVNTEPPVEE